MIPPGFTRQAYNALALHDAPDTPTEEKVSKGLLRATTQLLSYYLPACLGRRLNEGGPPESLSIAVDIVLTLTYVLSLLGGVVEVVEEHTDMHPAELRTSIWFIVGCFGAVLHAWDTRRPQEGILPGVYAILGLVLNYHEDTFLDACMDRIEAIRREAMILNATKAHS